MNKLGAQCQMRKGDLIEYCRIVRPVGALGINVRDRDFYERLGDLGVDPIYRHYPNFSGWLENPERCAVDAAKHLFGVVGHLADVMSYIVPMNEFVYDFNTHQHDAADRLSATLIDEIHDKFQGKVHVVSLNTNCGHYDGKSILHFHRTLEKTNACGKCLLGIHEYDWPDLWRLYCDGLVAGNGGMWLGLRYKRIMKGIRDAGYSNVYCGLTELGITQAVIPGRPDVGFRTLSPNLEEAARLYTRTLRWEWDAIMRDPWVRLATLYGCGMNDDWGTFDIWGTSIPQAIAQFKLHPEVK